MARMKSIVRFLVHAMICVGLALSGTLSMWGQAPVVPTLITNDPISDVRFYGDSGTCLGDADDTAALLAAITRSTNRVILPKNAACRVGSPLIIPSGSSIVLDLNGGTIQFSAQGGPCQQGSGGQFQVQNDGPTFTVMNGTLASTNASASCLLNFSNPTQFAHPFWIDHVNFIGPGGTSSEIMLYLNYAGLVHIDHVTAAGFGQYILSLTTLNNATIEKSVFQASNNGSYDIQLQNPEAVTISDNNFEVTPAVQISGGQAVTIRGGWAGDGNPTMPWFDITTMGGKIDGVWISGGTTGIAANGGAYYPITISNNYIFGVSNGIIANAPVVATGNIINFVNYGISGTSGNSSYTGNTFNAGAVQACINLNENYDVISGNQFKITSGTGINCASGGHHAITQSTDIGYWCVANNNNVIVAP